MKGGAMFIVRITIQVRNSRRKHKTYLRPESAYFHNTSSYAMRYDTMDEAEQAADYTAENFRVQGHTIICVDILKVSR